MKQFISKFLRDESGQDTVEYVLIGAAVATALTTGSTTLSGMLSGAIGKLNSAVLAAIP